MSKSHSDKALETLALQGTTGDDWFHPEVKWVEEERLTTLREKCPDCRGWRRVGVFAENGAYTGKDADCQRCFYSRGRFGNCLVTKVRKVMVGYIQWPAGVRFESRFGYGGNSRHQCELCAKGINKSNRVPLAAIKGDRALAMFVGEDCARKFTKVAKPAKPTKDQNPKKLDVILAENVAG